MLYSIQHTLQPKTLKTKPGLFLKLSHFYMQLTNSMLFLQLKPILFRSPEGYQGVCRMVSFHHPSITTFHSYWANFIHMTSNASSETENKFIWTMSLDQDAVMAKKTLFKRNDFLHQKWLAMAASKDLSLPNPSMQTSFSYRQVGFTKYILFVNHYL